MRKEIRKSALRVHWGCWWSWECHSEKTSASGQHFSWAEDKGICRTRSLLIWNVESDWGVGFPGFRPSPVLVWLVWALKQAWGRSVTADSSVPANLAMIRFLFAYLAVLRVRCSTWALVPWPGIKPGLLGWEHSIVTTGPAGRSPKWYGSWQFCFNLEAFGFSHIKWDFIINPFTIIYLSNSCQL